MMVTDSSDILNPQPLLDDSIEKPEDDDQLFNIDYPGDQSLFGGIQILLNTAMGSGTLMIPYCYTSGIGNALLISTIFCLISLGTLCLMIDTAHHSHGYDYFGLFAKAFSPKYLWIVDIILIIVLFGICSIYLYFGGHLFNVLLNVSKSPFNKDGFWICIIAAFLVFPIMCFKSLAKLESLAVLSTASLIILIIHSIYWFIKSGVKDGMDIQSHIKYFTFNKAFISCLSINSMAYHCHVNLFSCLEHLKNCTVKRAKSLTKWTMFVAFVLYQLLGIFAYLYLFDKIGNNSILDYYDQKNWFTKITTCCVVFIMIISTPLLAHTLRNALNELIFKNDPTTSRWIIMGACIIGIGAVLVSLYGKVITYFDLIGGFFLPCIVFLFPGMTFLRLFKNPPLYKKIFAIAMCVLAAAVGVVCLYKTISDMIKS